eukprot:scaffold6121_cov170-Amphora_coffeaeformis.AAC.8
MLLRDHTICQPRSKTQCQSKSASSHPVFFFFGARSDMHENRILSTIIILRSSINTPKKSTAIMFRFVFLSLCLLGLCSGFASRVQSRTIGVNVASSVVDYMEDDDLRFRQMLIKARECAFSDTASPVDARMFLSEILHLESGCMSGNLSGEICENVVEIAELVAHLRAKADAAAAVTATGATAALMSATAFVMTAAVLITTLDNGSGSTPYTLNEWIWAAQGGYLDQMVQHFVRNGGL